MLEICKSLDLRILNERTKGDTLGKIPFHRNRGVSTFDYIITNSHMYDWVDSFTVCQPTPFSDHSPLKGWFNISSPTNNSFPEMTGIELNHLPKLFQWNALSSERFINVSSSKDIQEMIQDKEHFISYDKKVVHNVVSRFNDIIETVAKRSLQIGVKTLGRHLEEITPGLIKNARFFKNTSNECLI